MPRTTALPTRESVAVLVPDGPAIARGRQGRALDARLGPLQRVRRVRRRRLCRAAISPRGPRVCAGHQLHDERNSPPAAPQRPARSARCSTYEALCAAASRRASCSLPPRAAAGGFVDRSQRTLRRRFGLHGAIAAVAEDRQARDDIPGGRAQAQQANSARHVQGRIVDHDQRGRRNRRGKRPPRPPLAPMPGAGEHHGGKQQHEVMCRGQSATRINVATIASPKRGGKPERILPARRSPGDGQQQATRRGHATASSAPSTRGPSIKQCTPSSRSGRRIPIVRSAGEAVARPISQPANRIGKALIARRRRIAGKSVARRILGVDGHRRATRCRGGRDWRRQPTSARRQQQQAQHQAQRDAADAGAGPGQRTIGAAANQPAASCSNNRKPTGTSGVTLSTIGKRQHAAGQKRAQPADRLSRQQAKAQQQQIQLQHAHLSALQAVERRKQRGGDGRAADPIGNRSEHRPLGLARARPRARSAGIRGSIPRSSAR